MADDVQLTDLEVIQRYSLAVRGATAPRADLVAALQADLDWLRGGRKASAPVKTATPAPEPAELAPAQAARKVARKAAAPAPATAAPVKAPRKVATGTKAPVTPRRRPTA